MTEHNEERQDERETGLWRRCRARLTEAGEAQRGDRDEEEGGDGPRRETD